MKKSKTTKDLEKMFHKLTISTEYCFEDFLVGELNNLPWLLKNPPKQKFRRVRGEVVAYRKRSRSSFRGMQDATHRQLYRHFIGELGQHPLVPQEGKEDYNPFNWKKEELPQPISLETAENAVDPELQDLVDELRRRREVGEKDIWEGVEEVFTALEIQQAKELLGD